MSKPHALITTITPPGFVMPVTLARPVSTKLAERLTENYARIDALNDANKSIDDAAQALNMEKTTFVSWLAALGYKWTNKKTYSTRKTRAADARR